MATGDEKEVPTGEQEYNEMRDFIGKLDFVPGATDLYDKTAGQTEEGGWSAVNRDIAEFLEAVDNKTWGDEGTFDPVREDLSYFAGRHGPNFMSEIRKAYGHGPTTPTGGRKDRGFFTPEKGGAPAFMPDTPVGGIRSPREGRSPERGTPSLKDKFRRTGDPSAKRRLRDRFGRKPLPARGGRPRSPPRRRPVFAPRPDYRNAYQSQATIMPTVPFPSGMANVDKYLRNLSRIGASRTPRREWVPLPRQLYVQPSAIRARMKSINHDMQSIWAELRKPVSRPQPQYGTEAQALAR